MKFQENGSILQGGHTEARSVPAEFDWTKNIPIPKKAESLEIPQQLQDLQLEIVSQVFQKSQLALYAIKTISTTKINELMYHCIDSYRIIGDELGNRAIDDDALMDLVVLLDRAASDINRPFTDEEITEISEVLNLQSKIYHLAEIATKMTFETKGTMTTKLQSFIRRLFRGDDSALPTELRIPVTAYNKQLAAEKKESSKNLLAILGVSPVPQILYDKGACYGADPQAFFQEKGGDVRPAQRICSNCTVFEECQEYALESREPFGVWGGLSEQDRRKIRASRKSADIIR